MTLAVHGEPNVMLACLGTGVIGIGSSDNMHPTVCTCLFVCNRAVLHGQECMALVTAELDYLNPEQ